ncbi:hypothetical protein PKCBPO_03183 [Methylorubrum thiocyanatum]|uniref:Uncharacterized protein n=1 Tax=Methylorubrum populi TaxID=223967 RepID=A0A833J9T4_9HYPH|nr:hypothetical protein [Methylorubrum populi]KAB7786011.1 hypothetical protein F8B43_1412 [Methylorubrum populi]
MSEVHLPLNPAGPAAYRTLSLSKGGRILASVPLVARDDDEALSLAMAMTRGAGVELWDGLRFMAHFGPEPVQTAAG